MKRILIFLLTFVFILKAGTCFAFEWKYLHERSREITLQKALEDVSNAPDSLGAQYVLGLVYINGHDYAQAASVFEKILKTDPSIFEARWGVAEAMRSMHEYDESAVIFKEIIKNHPSFAPAYNSLGYIKYLKMSFAEAASIIAKVLNMDKGKVDRYTLTIANGLYAAAKGMLAHYGGPLSKSINFFAVKKHLNIARKLSPNSVVTYFGYGSFYMSIPSVLGRDLDKAEESLLKATEVDPLFADPYVRLAQIYKKKGDIDNYKKFLSKALDLDPKNELAMDVVNGTCKFICLDK